MERLLGCLNPLCTRDFSSFFFSFLDLQGITMSSFVMICLLCSKKNFSIMIIHGNTENFKVIFK